MNPLIVEPLKPADWVIELKALAKDHNDQITPEIIVEHARKKASALHGMFTWDDTEAARLYRLTEAGDLIRRYKVRYVNKDEEEIKVGGFVNVTVRQEDNFPRLKVYMPIARVLESPEYTSEMLLNARRELATFRRKYSVLEELTTVITEIDRFIGSAATV